MNWYSIRVLSGYEKKVKATILNEVELAGIEDKVEEVVIPSERIVEMKDGKKKEKSGYFYPAICSSTCTWMAKRTMLSIM
jgi:transcriptional antiterminator NusG